MNNWFTDFMGEFGYIGVLLLIALENIFPPIPSEVILTFAGFLTTSSAMTIVGVIIFSTIGSVLGAVALYWIGSFLDEKRLGNIIEKYGHILRLEKEDLHKAQKWFEKYGPWTVFFCRFIPLIRSLISVPAGMAKMRFWLFLLLTTIGTAIWNTVLVLIGSALGESWQQVTKYTDIYSYIAYGLIGILLIVGIVWYVRKKRRD